MGGFSSKPRAAASAVTEVDRAILALKTQRRKLTDYQKRTQASVERERAAVRQWVGVGNKERALLALKKRRIQEDALQRVDAWVLKVEQQLVEVETASRQAEVVACLQVGQAAMAALQKEMRLEDVEKLLEDAEDSRAHLQEVQAMLDAQLSAEEEAAVLEELELLEAELGIADEATKEAEPSAAPRVDVPDLPSVPSHKVAVPTKAAEGGEEEEEEEEEEATSTERRREEPLPA